MIYKNKMKQVLKAGGIVFGPMISEIRSSGLAILFAKAGFDFFFLDMEHSCFTMETMSDMILAARAADIPVIVRPSSRQSEDHLSRPLDAGATGLLVPQIQNADDVRKVVKWCRYAPEGERGMALARQQTFFEAGNTVETMARLNEEVLVAIQIEDRRAVDNLPEILSVPGIDVAYVGPSDLSASYGKPGQSGAPEVEAAVLRVIEVCNETGVIPGIHTGSVDMARRWIEKGMKMVGYNTDIKLILEVCNRSVKALRALV